VTAGPGRDARLLREAARVIGAAIVDLQVAGRPTGLLAAALRSVRAEEAGPSLPDELVPVFIPNDLTRCTERTVLNCSASDDELDLPAGFAMEVSATRPDRFAMPYYPDPGLGSLTAARRPEDAGRTYALSFVGQRGPGEPGSPREVLRSPRATRLHFLRAVAADLVPTAGVRVRLQVNPPWSAVHWRGRWPAEAAAGTAASGEGSWRRRYVESLTDSRFVLCPRGIGANSIRFFETLGVGGIPIYAGERAARFPLDWIIDWDAACFRISCEEVADGATADRLLAILAVPDDEVERRRRYARDVYDQLLAPERRPVLDQLVLLRARALLRERAGHPAVAPAEGPPTLARCGDVAAVAIGDGVVATGHDDGATRLWDPCTGRLLRDLPRHRDAVVGIAAGDVGGALVVATAGNDCVAQVWCAGSDRPVVLDGHRAPVACVALGAVDGRPVVATGAADLTARLWDARTGAALATLEGHGAAIWGVAMGLVEGTPAVATASDDRSARVWDARDGRLLHRLAGHGDLVGCVALGEVEGVPVVATGCDDRAARLWDARTGRVLRTLRGAGGAVRAIALGVGGAGGRPVVVAGCGDGTIHTWDARTGVLLAVRRGRRAVRSVAIGELAGRPVVVAAGGEAGIRFLDCGGPAAWNQ